MRMKAAHYRSWGIGTCLRWVARKALSFVVQPVLSGVVDVPVVYPVKQSEQSTTDESIGCERNTQKYVAPAHEEATFMIRIPLLRKPVVASRGGLHNKGMLRMTRRPMRTRSLAHEFG